MNTLQLMDRYRKEVIQVNTYNIDIKLQYLCNNYYKEQLVWLYFNLSSNPSFFIFWRAGQGQYNTSGLLPKECHPSHKVTPRQSLQSDQQRGGQEVLRQGRDQLGGGLSRH